MNHLNLMKRFLMMLLTLAFLGLVGCSQPAPTVPVPVQGDTVPGDTQSLPTTAGSTDSIDKQEPDPLPTDEPATGLKALLPLLFNQSFPHPPSGITADANCSELDPHPIGQDIAETYVVPYEQVMGWFCSGYSFDNILVALETSEATDYPPGALLQMLLEKEWEEIWEEIGFVDNQ